MEFLTEFGFVGIISFGSVGVLSFFLARYRPNWKFSSSEKAVAFAVFAFIYGFVPAEFGNVLAERAKDALYLTATFTAAYGATKGVAKKVGGN